MTPSRRGFLIVALAQLLVVVGFAGFRQAAVGFGTEVVLQTAPVDPRDIFRGDYVILSYEISSLEFCVFGGGGTLYVGLTEDADGVWRARPSAAWPDYDTAAQHGDVVIRGMLVSGEDGASCQVSYGIESYFVPEGTGHRIERLSGELKVRVAVAGDGSAVIDELIFPD